MYLLSSVEVTPDLGGADLTFVQLTLLGASSVTFLPAQSILTVTTDHYRGKQSGLILRLERKMDEI